MEDCYKILGIKPNDSPDTVKKAYRELAKTYHPDLNKSRNAEYFFVKIKDAYEILSDPEKRLHYDLEMGYHNKDFGINERYEEDNNESDYNEPAFYDEYTQYHNNKQTASANVENNNNPIPKFEAEFIVVFPMLFVFISTIAIFINMIGSDDMTFFGEVKYLAAVCVIGIIIGFICDLFSFLRDRWNWQRGRP